MRKAKKKKKVPWPFSNVHLHPQGTPKVYFSHCSQRELLNKQISILITCTHLCITLSHPHCIFQSLSKSQEHSMLTLLSQPLHMLFPLPGRPSVPMSTNQIPHPRLDNCYSCFRSHLRCYLLWEVFLVPARLVIPSQCYLNILG